VNTVAHELSDQAYRILVDLVHEHSHIRLGPDKQLMLANRLRRRAHALGFDSCSDYAVALAERGDADEVEELVDLVSTNHTQFFREAEHFEFLAKTVVPEFLSGALASGSPLRVWSAAASSGEEPYSIAVMLAEQLRGHPKAQWEVLASDISKRMLAHAQLGVYRMDRVGGVRSEWLQRYFEQGFAESLGKCRVRAELRRRIQFERINLFQDRYPLTARQHVIFCRNVMIYFDLPSRAAAVDKLTSQLVPGGYLVVGYSESLLGVEHRLQQVGQGIYKLP
jgi:chemotaxis protein methyltransferase CheR